MNGAESPPSWRQYCRGRSGVSSDLGSLARYTYTTPFTDLLLHTRPHVFVGNELDGRATATMTQAVEIIKNLTTILNRNQRSDSTAGSVTPERCIFEWDFLQLHAGQTGVIKKSSRVLSC